MWKILDIVYLHRFPAAVLLYLPKEEKQQRCRTSKSPLKKNVNEHSCDGHKSPAALCAHLSRFPAVSSFLHFSLPATLLNGSSLRWLQCRLWKCVTWLHYVNHFFPPPANLQCFFGFARRISKSHCHQSFKTICFWRNMLVMFCGNSLLLFRRLKGSNSVRRCL